MHDNDLISRTAAIEELMKMVECYSVHDVFRGELLHYTGIKTMLECIPAVDAVPVVHAHWIEYYTDIMCSHCHATYKDEISDTYQDSVDHRRYVGLEYCPHCGALMLGDDEDD